MRVHKNGEKENTKTKGIARLREKERENDISLSWQGKNGIKVLIT